MIKNAKIATKKLNFDLKVVSVKSVAGECIIEGYANTSTKDRVGDVVLPSAFQKSLPTYLKNPIILENHNWEKVAGRAISAEITDDGLYIKARISDTRPDLKTQIFEGCLSTFSIGYNELDADFDNTTQTKLIKDLELLEISVVSVPANPEATFKVSGEPEAAKAAMCEDCKKDPCACDESKKSASSKESKIQASPTTAADLKSFLDVAREAAGEALDDETVIALCDFFTDGDDNLMKLNRKQLVEALKASIKSAKDAAAAPAVDAAAGKKDDAATPPADDQAQAGSADVADALKQLNQKLDMIAQALAQILDDSKEGDDQAQSDDASKKPEGDKPADDQAGKSAGAEQTEDMDLSEVDQKLAEINAQLEDLEDVDSDDQE